MSRGSSSTVVCDPELENGIIVVYAIYNPDGNKSVFQGAPCWHTTRPEIDMGRKRSRRFGDATEERPFGASNDWDQMTFVTTAYTAGASFAGICIGRPTDYRALVASVGVAISGAITVRLPNPEPPDDPAAPKKERPAPGTSAFFGDGGKILFGPREDRVVDCVRGIIGRKTGDKLTTDEMKRIANISFGDEHPPTPIDAAANEEDVPGRAANCVSRMTGIGVETVTERLRTLETDGISSETNPETRSGPSWARVLDTGSGGTVRVLLRLA